MSEGELPVLVVDAANVVGARPDGWWRDRRGAAERLVASLARASADGVEDVAGRRIVVVLEGQARGVADVDGGVELVRAEGSGDDAIVAVVRDLASSAVTVVTSDRELRRRVAALGARTAGAGWLRAALDG